MSVDPPATWLRAAPPERIDGAHLTLRRWRTADLDALTSVIDDSLDLLRPWLPWAAEHDRAAVQRFLAQVVPAWHARSDFNYAITDPAGEILGGAGLHGRIGPGGLELGYWVRADATRRRVATRAAALLTAAALAIDGVTRVEIHHDRANEISGRVPRRLGYAHVGVGERPRDTPAACGVEVRWRLTRDAYATSMARTLVADHPGVQP